MHASLRDMHLHGCLLETNAARIGQLWPDEQVVLPGPVTVQDSAGAPLAFCSWSQYFVVPCQGLGPATSGLAGRCHGVSRQVFKACPALHAALASELHQSGRSKCCRVMLTGLKPGAPLPIPHGADYDQ